MNESCSERSKLMQQIFESEFMVIELGLYLDTHPDCAKGLAEYHKYRSSYEMHRAEYEREYGPLTIYSVNSENYWTWINDPWPWEMEAY